MRIFHLAATALLVTLIFGAYIDARAHIHQGFTIHSFFVPTHWGLHGAWLGMCALLVVYAFRGARRGLSPRQWLPPGYNVTALGALAWGVAGGFDLIWHSLFGFEVNVETVYTPSHLALLGSSVLMTLGVLRYSLRARSSHSQAQHHVAVELPLIVAVAALLEGAMWITWYSDPATNDFASGGQFVRGLAAMTGVQYTGPSSEIAGITGILLNSLVLMLFLTFALYRLRLPSGALVLIASYYVLQKAWAVDTLVYAPAFVGGALAGEAIWAWIRRGGEVRLSSPLGYRLIGAVVPGVQIGLYFATIAWVGSGIVWVVHLWVGTIVLSAAVGLLATFVTVPPTQPALVAQRPS